MTFTLQDAICRLVIVDVTMPTDRAALEMITSAKTVYNTVDIAGVEHLSKPTISCNSV